MDNNPALAAKKFSDHFDKPLSSHRFARLSLQEQSLFAKRLSLLIKAGVSLFDGVHMLSQGARTRANKKMFEQITNDIANGQFLSKSMSRWRRVFGDFAINLIYVGETTGTLADNLKYLADEIEKKRRLRQKVVGALVYPIVVMIAAFAVSGLMTAYLFPKLLPIFNSLNVPLPFTTKILLWLSDFLINYWYLLIGGIIALVVAFVVALRTSKAFRYTYNTLTLKLPIVGTILQHYHLINMCRTLGILFKSNVRVLEAVDITAETSASLVYKKAIVGLHETVTKGGTLAKHFATKPKLFPLMLTQLIAVGETTGNLSDTLMYLGEIYENELDEQTKRLSSVIEPAMMIFMGLLVGFIAVSIITPIYEVTQHLNPRQN